MRAPVDKNYDEYYEEDARLLAEIHSNRAAMFMKMNLWDAAVRDAERAVTLPGREKWMKGLQRLGTALLGAGRIEDAYTTFSKIMPMIPAGVPDSHPAKQGLQACLYLLPQWRSLRAEARFSRFWRDGRRPTTSTRICVMSDIHFDHPDANEWVFSISNSKFQEDVLIVAGDLAETLGKVQLCLRHLRMKFRRVFFVPGNHDLWIHTAEDGVYADSFDKLFQLLKMCDEIDVDVFPAAVCEGVFVVPLFSWYNADFDEDDPFPYSGMTFDGWAKWPVDRDNKLWRYMLWLNRRFMEMPYPGEVITFSHFLPRVELPYWDHQPGLSKAVGCPQLDSQIRQLRSQVHVFGHSHCHCNKVIEGVRYVQSPLGYTKEHQPNEPISCIYDGRERNGLISRTLPIL